MQVEILDYVVNVFQTNIESYVPSRTSTFAENIKQQIL